MSRPVNVPVMAQAAVVLLETIATELTRLDFAPKARGDLARVLERLRFFHDDQRPAAGAFTPRLMIEYTSTILAGLDIAEHTVAAAPAEARRQFDGVLATLRRNLRAARRAAVEAARTPASPPGPPAG